jgi:hypothetical protein
LKRPVVVCVECLRQRLHRGFGLCDPCYMRLRRRATGRSRNSFKAPHPKPRPTDALPGTPEKLAVMAGRAAAMAPLFHPLDAKWGAAGGPACLPLSTPGRNYHRVLS